MTIRGFMDWYGSDTENYSGTASRLSQRLIASEFACHAAKDDWILVTIDVEKAFLQGMTYREIEESTGERERLVCFSLPPGSAAAIRHLPGYEDFDERYEVLRCVKPGTGTKGAPRAFALKLAKVTTGSVCMFAPTTYDRELEVRHDSHPQDGRTLVAMASKHVDDLKLAGQRHVIKKEVIPEMEKVFGKLR